MSLIRTEKPRPCNFQRQDFGILIILNPNAEQTIWMCAIFPCSLSHLVVLNCFHLGGSTLIRNYNPKVNGSAAEKTDKNPICYLHMVTNVDINCYIFYYTCYEMHFGNGLDSFAIVIERSAGENKKKNNNKWPMFYENGWPTIKMNNTWIRWNGKEKHTHTLEWYGREMHATRFNFNSISFHTQQD